jgi:diguanylate cyclase
VEARFPWEILMPTEQEWRDKYRDVLSRLAAEEARWSKGQNVLKLLIGRLCLAAQGRDDRLDHEIGRVADVARKQIDVDALDLLIAPLSAAVAALDSADSGGSGVRRGPKAEHAGPAKTDSTGSVPVISRDGVHGAATAASGVASPASAAVAAAAPDDGDAAVSPATTTDEAFGATAVLDRLALLPELKPVVGELRSRKNDSLGIHELADLLERVTRFATEQRSQVQKEKLELQNIVQQLASRLEEISQSISGELAERNVGQEDCEQLNIRVTDEVTQLRLTAETANDIATLRQQLSTRLDAISSHLTDFRLREETRVRTYRDRVTRMRTRIAVLERESRSLHESLREEQRLAMIDALTGIPNRAAYDDRIEQEHKRWKRFTRPVSILAWDIDRFKTINDAYGHKAGDKVLRVIGQHLARHVRDTDFVGRYGGEEFVMLLVGTEPDEARTVAEKIRLEISQLGFHFHDRPVSVTASCGITGFRGEDSPDAAFDRADKALYQAKEAGRNCCIVV